VEEYSDVSLPFYRAKELWETHSYFCGSVVYQGLIPWAWIEASTKGAVLLFAAAEIEGAAMNAGLGSASAGLLGGMGGGVAQAYATVGFCTCMKTAEITRSKMAVGGVEPPST